MASALNRGIRNLWKIRNNVRLFASNDKSPTLFEDDPSFASGKSVEVSILNMDEEGVFIDAYSCVGFRLNSGIRVIGPCAIFPKSVLHWNVRGITDVNEQSLSLFTMLEPKLDLLVLGVGQRENLQKVNPEIIRYLRSHKLNIEVLTTDQALATYNFLNSEKRFVAGAFIPPNYMEDFDDDEDARFALLDEQQGQKIHAIGDMFLPNEVDPIQLEQVKGQLKKSRQEITDKIYRKEAREKDKRENPDKYYD